MILQKAAWQILKNLKTDNANWEIICMLQVMNEIGQHQITDTAHDYGDMKKV